MGDDETGESLQFCPMKSPLHFAAFSGNVKLLQETLRKGEDVNMIQCTVPALYVACLKGHKNVVEVLVKNNCDINAPSVELQQTGLHCAASRGLEKIVKYLIKNGAEVNRQDSYGATPMFLSAQYGHTDIAKCLIGSSAAVNTSDKKGLSPLAIATLNGRTGVADLLIRKKAKLDQQDQHGNTALFHAVKSGQRQICQLLTKAGASVNTPNVDGDYPISISAMYGNVIMIENLISRGCDVNVVSPNGTPVFAAVQRQHANALQKLISAGADVRKVGGKKARDPLLEAMHQNKANAQVMRDLIASGSDVDVKCDCHPRPFQALLSKYHGNAMRVLMMCDAPVGRVLQSKIDEMEQVCGQLHACLKMGDQPLKLKALCRKAVKKAIGSVNYSQKVNKLKQPLFLKNYLLYKEVQVVTCTVDPEDHVNTNKNITPNLYKGSVKAY